MLVDFNKLLLSAAPNKLMVTKKRFTEFLQDAAIGHDQRGDIYVAYVPPFQGEQKEEQAGVRGVVD